MSAIPGVELVNDSFFNEFTLELPVEARPAVHAMVERGVLGGVSLGRLYPGVDALKNGLVVAVTEVVSDEDIDALEAALKEVCNDLATGNPAGEPNPRAGARSPTGEARRADRHRQPRADARRAAAVRDRQPRPDRRRFRSAKAPRLAPWRPRARRPSVFPGLSEPETVRHYTRLSRQNYAIDLGLFPLGSCTMKHNPRLNEKMARLPGFADIHPLQPQETVQGALELINQLAFWLIDLTGMHGVAMSPKAGAHGELCGLLCIRAALEARGDAREVVLVPESAHGTNPATAAFCGYRVENIPATKAGRVDLEALEGPARARTSPR